MEHGGSPKAYVGVIYQWQSALLMEIRFCTVFMIGSKWTAAFLQLLMLIDMAM